MALAESQAGMDEQSSHKLEWFVGTDPTSLARGEKNSCIGRISCVAAHGSLVSPAPDTCQILQIVLDFDTISMTTLGPEAWIP